MKASTRRGAAPRRVEFRGAYVVK
ncbi:Protein of unknown function [Propionibacterium freudenreichii]|nr:Protein of unknown function [Propionibacterium freudenreichii subsp. freudenreichii]CEG85454.1 Protein of unknown function [Propionibacterium freudenreichii]CEG96455.1 Protein of unknown function [Propionibacterium freudenreichii]CEG98487.1 Protein of unknown function [Propionibacterium freudenreichii]CEH10067.1 Protein of unknown function [Propionibacterium freudenreichii]